MLAPVRFGTYFMLDAMTPELHRVLQASRPSMSTTLYRLNEPDVFEIVTNGQPKVDAGIRSFSRERAIGFWEGGDGSESYETSQKMLEHYRDSALDSGLFDRPLN